MQSISPADQHYRSTNKQLIPAATLQLSPQNSQQSCDQASTPSLKASKLSSSSPSCSNESQPQKLNISTQQKIINLLKQLTDIKPAINFQDSSVSPQFTRLYKIKHCFQTECRNSQFEHCQIGNQLADLEKSIQQVNIKNEASRNRKIVGIIDRIEEQIELYEQSLKEIEQLTQDKVKNIQTKCLHARMSLKQLQQIQKHDQCENLNYQISASRLQTLQHRINNLNQFDPKLYYNIKNEFRKLKQDIDREKKINAKEQTDFYRTLEEMDNVLSTHVAHEKQIQSQSFSDHYTTLERIFALCAEDLM